MTERMRIREVAEVNPPVPEFDDVPPDAAITFVPLEAVWPGSRLDLSRVRPKAEVATGYVRFREGDILVPKVTPTFQAARSVLAMGVPTIIGAASTEVHTVRVRPGNDPRYVMYAFHTERFLGEGVSAFQGVAGLQRVSDAFIRDFRVRRRTLAEQHRISDFLDEQVARIDEVVRLREQQIDALDEQRGAFIEAAMMKSGPPRRLKSVLLRRPDYGANAAAEFIDPRWPRFIRTTDVTSDGRLRPDTFRSLPPSEGRPFMLSDGDVLFTRSGATVGKSFIYRATWGPAAFAGYLIRVRPNPDLMTPEWLSFFAETPTYWSQIAESAIQATIPNVNAEKYASLVLPLPPKPVQEEIVRVIADTVEQKRAATGKMRAQIELLQERKRSLITAAVTGEFDVSSASGRGVA